MTTDSQRIWLKSIAQRIPILFKAIAEGQYKASFIIGHRLVDGKACRLYLVAEIVDMSDEAVAKK
ncbi:hypothetical protein N9850_06280 [Granulosicoccus sp.]|nr:hypothetical protein [Granulosicoccus sp.]MDB4223360.1 hypothetical protein [Granulosicoccus sp.]